MKEIPVAFYSFCKPIIYKLSRHFQGGMKAVLQQIVVSVTL